MIYVIDETTRRSDEIRDGDHGDHPTRQIVKEWNSSTGQVTYLASGGVGGDGGDILNASNTHSSTGEGTESALGAGAGGFCASSASSTELDMEGSDTDFTATGGDVLGSQHRGVRRGFITISLNLHAT